MLCAFFFQAEDGIRDKLVTGVQTCALPISLVEERAPVVGRYVVERVDDIVERVGLDQRRGGRRAVEAADEVVERALPRSELTYERVGVEPNQLALVVEVNAAALRRPLDGRVVEELRGDRRVNQRTPQTARSVVESGGHVREVVPVLFRRPESAARRQNVAVILGQPLVNPEQLVLHRLLVVACGKPRGPSVLAVPGVEVFVREDAPGEARRRLVNERALGDAAVVRLMVFESEVRDAVT